MEPGIVFTYIYFILYTDENRDRVGLVILYLLYYAIMRWAGKQEKKKQSKSEYKYNARLRDEIQLNEGKLNKKQSKHIMSSEESSSKLLKADLIPLRGRLSFKTTKTSHSYPM